MTADPPADLTLRVKSVEATAISAEQRKEIATWIEENRPHFPEAVRSFLELQLAYLAAEGNPKKQFNHYAQELRRALGITPSSERRSSGAPLSAIPREAPLARVSEREKLEAQIDRGDRLGEWHVGLVGQHQAKVARLKEKLAKMGNEQRTGDSQEVPEDDVPVEEIELPIEQQAAPEAKPHHPLTLCLLKGNGKDPALTSVNETLMPGGSVLAIEEHKSLPAVVPAEHSGAKVLKSMNEERVRYDFSVSVTRLVLDVEKKIFEDAKGERHVITASTREYGPPHHTVTWSALATLAVLVGQFAVPMHRLGVMLSTAGKRFTAGALSRLLHYVAERLLPIYLKLGEQLADAEILAGDDTSSRVLEVSTYFAKQAAPAASTSEDNAPVPWADYRSPAASAASIGRRRELRAERKRRRENGDRTAKPTQSEKPTLGELIGQRLAFESPRKNGDGPKESLNTTVISGRRVPKDPTSLIVFYRTHLGGYGNLLESILSNRRSASGDVIVQGDLSSSNLVTSPNILARFKVTWIGCTAHARRPFANYEHEDPTCCGYMLHLFLGLAIHEQQLDVFGRNRDNVLAVRGTESRTMWANILDLAKFMSECWSPATKLGAAARYIIKNFEKLTAYLDDPRLEATNNLRERMLRTEKLIEGSSMFRKSLEGRFVLDVVRTISQTAVAAGVPVHEYLLSVLRADPSDVEADPARYTPSAWAAANAGDPP